MNKIHYTISFCFDNDGVELVDYLEKYFISVISRRIEESDE